MENSHTKVLYTFVSVYIMIKLITVLLLIQYLSVTSSLGCLLVRHMSSDAFRSRGFGLPIQPKIGVCYSAMWSTK